jgi:hypothetical protein
MTPEEVYHCFEGVLGLPLPKQAVCVRLAAELTVPVWREWCGQRGVQDHSGELLDTFGRWQQGAAPDEQLDEIARRHYQSLPQDLRKEEEPAGGYAGWALLGVASVALDQCGEVHHSILHTDICYAAAAHCRIGVEAVWVSLDRLSACELEFLDRWWCRCREQFPELDGARARLTRCCGQGNGIVSRLRRVDGDPRGAQLRNNRGSRSCTRRSTVPPALNTAS